MSSAFSIVLEVMTSNPFSIVSVASESLKSGVKKVVKELGMNDEVLADVWRNIITVNLRGSIQVAIELMEAMFGFFRLFSTWCGLRQSTLQYGKGSRNGQKPCFGDICFTSE